MTTGAQNRRPRFTYANVVATVAVFLAMGGAGALAAGHLGRATVGGPQLKPDAVTGAKVKDGSLTGADIVAAGIGKVPTAAHADSATSADQAVNARRAESAAHADTATSAATASRAGSAATLTPNEAVHFIDGPGEPKNLGSFKVIAPAGFYRDHEGIVHLQGHLEPTIEAAGLFTEIPPGYRPEEIQLFFSVTPKSSARVLVTPSGRIEALGAAKEEIISLDGLTWRADERTEA